MSERIAVRWWVGLAGLAVCGAAAAQPPAAAPVMMPKADAPLTVRAGRQQIRVALVADGLVAPWDIVFIPGTSDLLVSESNGKLRMIQGGKLLPDAVGRRRRRPATTSCTASSFTPTLRRIGSCMSRT